MAANIIFIVLSLILNYFSFELAVAVYKGFFIGRPLFCVLCDPYIFIRSGDVVRRYFWPIKAWDGWLSPLVLKVENAKKAFTPP